MLLAGHLAHRGLGVQQGTKLTSACPRGLYILVGMTNDQRDKYVSRILVTCAKEGREEMGHPKVLGCVILNGVLGKIMMGG